MIERTYSDSSYKPIAENTTHCVSRIAWPWNWHFRQCTRKRGHGKDGLHCRQHAKKESKDE